MTTATGNRRHASRRSSQRFGSSPARRTIMAVVVLMAVGAMYLAVSAEAANAGREVLQLERRREELMQQNAELTARLASLTDPARMRARADELGFRPAGPQDIEFVEVEGLPGQDEFAAPRPPAEGQRGEAALSPAYTETLGEWIERVLGSEAGP